MGKQGNGRLIGRRQFVKIGAVAGTSALLYGLVGCAPESKGQGLGNTSSDQGFTAGTYSSTTTGRKGPVEVKVTFSENAIESIELGKNYETPRIAEAAVDGLCTDIVELQSLNVDTVSGATLTSMAILQGVRDCVEQAGGSVKKLEQGDSREKKTDVQELEADLVIVGAGGAGFPAAVEAAENGAKVIVLEKNAYLGGSMLVAHGLIQYPDAPVEYRIENDPAYDALFKSYMSRARDMGMDETMLQSIEKDYADWYAAGNTKVFDSMDFWSVVFSVGVGVDMGPAGLIDGQACKLTVEHLRDHCGVEMDKDIGCTAGFQWPRRTHTSNGASGYGMIDGIEKLISDKDLTNLEIIFSTKADELIMDDGKVVGVSGTCADGTTYKVKGSKGVVLATGGYENNIERLKELDGEWPFIQEGRLRAIGVGDGSGIDLAEQAGAKAYGNGGLMIIPYASPEWTTLDATVGDGSGPLVVNKSGKRFVNETLSRTAISKAVLEQADEMCFTIAGPSGAKSHGVPEGMTIAHDKIDEMVERGLAVQANTIPELAEALGIPSDTLQETVREFDQACAAGAPDEFGRTFFTPEAPIGDEGPFYGVPGTWAVLITTGSLATNEHRNVLNESMEPIEGLYSIGELSGQIGMQCLGYGVSFARSHLGVA